MNRSSDLSPFCHFCINRMTTEAGIHAREAINRLLLSAGYFRVRMCDLDDFDKIAGGLAWCLKASSVDVDINIFFKEKPNVGEKVRISESICEGLRLAKCPLGLKPHQIQGLDFPYLFPIFQWLVKNVIEVRNEFGDFQHSYAEFSFKNQYAELPADITAHKNSMTSASNIRQMEKFFPPRRFYKRSAWNESLPEIKQIETTLLEYGKIPTSISAESQKGNPKMAKMSAKAQQEAAENQNKREEELRQTLSTMNRQAGDSAIDGSIIANSLVNQAGTILANQNIFDESETKLSMYTEADLRQQHETTVTRLKEHLQTIKAQGRKVQSTSEDVQSELDAATKSLQDARAKNADLKSKIKEAAAVVEDAQHTEAIMHAMTLRDDNRKNIEEFAAQCKAEIVEWNERIAALKAKAEGSGDANAIKLQQALEQYTKDWQRKQELVAEKAREVLKLRMEYDLYPTMAELSQYSRRLKELSALSLSKIVEIKKCTQLLNSLISSTNILEQENTLFNNIIQNFQDSKKDTGLQRNLISQTTSISNKTKEEKTRLDGEIEKKAKELQTKEEQHRKLLETQRRYFQAVKEYQEAQDQLADLLDEDEGDAAEDEGEEEE